MAKKRIKFGHRDINEFQAEYREESGEGKKRQDNITHAKDITIKGACVHDVIVKVNERLTHEIKSNIGVLYKDPSFDIYRNTKICAEVVSVPKRLNGTVLYEHDPGFPSPQGRVDAEGKRTHTNHKRSFATLEGTPIEVDEGDKVYFHYLTLTDQNYIGKDTEGMELYKCGYDQIFCVVREYYFHTKPLKGGDFVTTVDNTITMLNGWIAVKPYYDESYEAVEIPELSVLGESTGKTRTIRVKQSDSGIIYDMTEKPLYRHGELAMMGDVPDGKKYGVRVGDRIVYTHYSEFTNTIEGEEYYIMRIWDIVGVYRHGELIPINDRVLIDTQQETTSKLIIPDQYKPKPHDATVLATGNIFNSISYRILCIMTFSKW